MAETDRSEIMKSFDFFMTVDQALDAPLNPELSYEESIAAVRGLKELIGDYRNGSFHTDHPITPPDLRNIEKQADRLIALDDKSRANPEPSSDDSQ